MVTGTPYILEVSLRYKKAIFWLARALEMRGSHIFYIKIFQEFYDILCLNSSLTLTKKKEHYGYGVFYKRAKKFK